MRRFTITPANIDKESYYNCLQLCKITEYANPIAAIKSLNTEWSVMKDDNGNIVRAA